MKIQYRLLFAMLLVMASAQSHAGRQGIHFLYGAGVSVVAPQVRSNIVSHDPAPAAELIVGIEEDGWAAEVNLGRSLDTGTGSTDGVDYNIAMSTVSLSYRTVERNNRYYKYKYGKMDQDYDFVSTGSTPLAGDTTISTSGDVYSFAMGFRMKQAERLEVEYAYYSKKKEDSTSPYLSGAHMISLRYIFGGAPYDGGGF